MILCHMMKCVRVKRDYEIEIDLTVDCEQLGLGAEIDGTVAEFEPETDDSEKSA
jgi:hypothetical protein